MYPGTGDGQGDSHTRMDPRGLHVGHAHVAVEGRDAALEVAAAVEAGAACRLAGEARAATGGALTKKVTVS